IFQRRQDGSEDFFRGWDDYVSGFGKLDGEFWLGDKCFNLQIERTPTDGLSTFDLEDFDGNKTFATYSTFVVSGPSFYSLQVSGYQGTAGDAMLSSKFTTNDRDQDESNHENCAIVYKGAWWYRNCHSANLNGLYLRGAHESYADGVNWRFWRGYHYSLKVTEMKLKL
uniref:Fibrinogen C-terminal domain-containing protein n=1 Tax=Ciona savignyi TaxID=51511 RepID=H2Y5Y8_CIOSA